MNGLYQQLWLIQDMTWFFYVLAMLLFYGIAKYWPNSYSSLITMIIVVAVGTVTIGFEALLSAHHQHLIVQVSTLWFIGLASFEIIAMLALLLIHKKENLRIGRLGQLVGFSFFARCTLQLLQYGEIVVFQTNQRIFTLYTLGLPTINIAIAILSMIFALLAIYHLCWNEKGLKGLRKWYI